MFLLDDGSLAVSAQDLRLVSECELALLDRLDVTLGRTPRRAEEDPMLERLAELGDAHEARELERLQTEHPGGVVIGERPRRFGLEGYRKGATWTLRACADPATQVVHQAPVLLEGGEGLLPLVGMVDFLTRTPAGWRVGDTKLAARSTVASMLQVAAYADALARGGLTVAPEVDLVLGTGAVESHPLGPTVAVMRDRWAHLSRLLSEHREAEGPVRWGAAGVAACGRCEVCAPLAEAADDLLGVARMSLARRKVLHEAGIRTMAELAGSTTPPAGMRAAVFAELRDQAALQVRARAETARRREADPEAPPVVLSEVIDPAPLEALPAPGPGDVFFDFEGDPMWRPRPNAPAGLEYLFGVEVLTVDAGEDDAAYGPPDAAGARYRAWWAHDRAGERQALGDFLSWLADRRERHPGLHVYHYAAYEVTALKRLTAVHGFGAELLDQLLREHVFVDLYGTVRAGIRVSQASYSIKKLEPLYMPARDAEGVTGGGDSIVEYHRYCQARDAGDAPRAAGLLERIRAYNELDCESTWRLRDWLLAQRHTAAGGDAQDDGQRAPEEASSGGTLVEAPAPQAPERWVEAERLEAALRALDLPEPGARTAAEQATAMVSAAPQYYRREHKPFWWAHFDRLALPVAEWALTGDVLVVERAAWTDDWARPTPRSNPRRTLRTVVDTGGRPVAPGTTLHAVFAHPLPEGLEAEPGHPHALWPSAATVVDSGPHPDSGLELCTLELPCPQPRGDRPGLPETDELPVGLVPTPPPSTGPLDAALAELAEEVLGAHPGLPPGAASDLLTRRTPRLQGGGALPRVGAPGTPTPLDAVTTAVRALDDSYVAVQGPPGTGKTYLGSRVVRSLVQQGWKVGVVAQSHAAVENFLGACVRAGVPAEQVAKVPRSGRSAEDAEPTWTALQGSRQPAAWMDEQSEAGRGFVVGGTAWTFSKDALEPGGLDLLVVDEAGQFSLAPLLACSRAARNLLLLGDPQQLPQVSQGIHPEPLDRSALGWLIGSAAVLPADLGYFLDTTWRMHPALTEPVSRLAYDGRLRSHEAVTTGRTVEGVEPGVHEVLVDHRDQSVASPEEAAEVVRLVESLRGRAFRDGAGGGTARPLEASDVLVVAPYNAQVNLLRQRLDAAGLSETPVGTVDAFQGQEAPVVIVSMTASARDRVSRGLAFLLDVHRMNVAISRGQLAAYVVRSPRLTDIAPASPRDLLALGAFLELLGRAR
ncbi:uncharacterized protein SAMN05445756_1237 [Kytococcus aerolatus]|uniref:AAA+ ATPase domain-containing protein n=1 Tax=Kytococcus aerolatus TaxID=592308 RepID=A0A212TG97_9MICO|nr:bifunctional RecB family nuclease/DEAD/DEAH box helicase [Kytococcus aerolatus]SNC65042.1 uncharacterized protein SAMN05445756_1237 [Kytococcus aerolatus]